MDLKCYTKNRHLITTYVSVAVTRDFVHESRLIGWSDKILIGWTIAGVTFIRPCVSCQLNACWHVVVQHFYM